MFILSRFVDKVASQQLSGSERLTAQGHVFISFFTKIFRGRHNLNNILRCLELYCDPSAYVLRPNPSIYTRLCLRSSYQVCEPFNSDLSLLLPSLTREILFPRGRKLSQPDSYVSPTLSRAGELRAWRSYNTVWDSRLFKIFRQLCSRKTSPCILLLGLFLPPQSIYFSRFLSYTKKILAVAENTQKYLDVNLLNLIDFHDFTTKLQC